jgi:hypothetical protein
MSATTQPSEEDSGLLLVAKIRALLLIDDDDGSLSKDRMARFKGGGVAFSDERRLVACLLLTRVRDNGEFMKLLLGCTENDENDASRCLVLLEWMMKRLFRHQEPPPLQQQLCFARLAAQLFFRMVQITNDAESAPNAMNMTVSSKVPVQQSVDRVGQGLLQYFCALNNEPMVSVARVEILIALQVWLENQVGCQGDVSKLDDVLLQIGEMAVVNMEKKHETVDKTTSTPSDNQSQEQLLLMEQTLTALLDQTSLVDLKKDESLEQLYQEHLTHLVLQNGIRIAARKLPFFYRPLITQWLSQSKSLKGRANQPRLSWAEVLLSTMQAYAHSADATSLQKTLHLLYDATPLSNDLVQLILACIVSTEGSSHGVRVAAWSAVATLVQTAGWDWLLLQPPSNSSFGTSGKLCALIRLSTGEWKIQLDAALANSSSSSFALIIEACGAVLVQAVEYIVLLDMEDGGKKMPLSGDAVLHIRRSLEEAFNVTWCWPRLGKVVATWWTVQPSVSWEPY